MSEPGSFDWMKVWAAATLTGVAIFGYLLVFFFGFALGSAGNEGVIFAIGAAVLAALAGISGVLAHRRGRWEIAVGIWGGYGLMALVSGGVCVLIPGWDAGGFVGLIGYPLLMLVALIVVQIARGSQRRGTPQ